MFILFIFLSIVILKVDAVIDNETGNTEIRVKVGHETNNIYTVLKDKPLRIILENGYARQAWCSNSFTENSKPKFAYGEFANNIVNILNVANVTAAMSTRWKCTIRQNYNPGGKGKYSETDGVEYSDVTEYFDVKVKSAKSVKITVNGVDLNVETTDLSVTEYDGVARYSYEEHELVDLNCTREDDDGELLLEYYDAGGTLLVGPTNQTQSFRSLLGWEHKKYYIVCTINTIKPNRQYRYKTTFIPNDFNKNIVRAITVFINGLRLIPLPSNAHNIVNYQYKYVDGEILNITSLKNVDGSWLVNYEKSGISTNDYKVPSPRNLTTNVNTALSTTNITAITYKINNITAAKISFKSDLPENGVRIVGLPLKNVEYQYSKAASQWSIVYQYTVDEILDLTCVSKNRNNVMMIFTWNVDGEIMYSKSNYVTDQDSIIQSSDRFLKTLDESHNQTTIECIGGNNYNDKTRRVEIILHLKSIVGAEDNVNVTSDSQLELQTWVKIVLSVSVGVIIGVICTICLICWCSRRKNTKFIRNSYDNLSNENDSPIPVFPRQWNHNDCNNPMHNDEDHYTEIDDSPFEFEHNNIASNWKTVQPDKNGRKLRDTRYDSLRRSNSEINNVRLEITPESTTREDNHYSVGLIGEGSTRGPTLDPVLIQVNPKRDTQMKYQKDNAFVYAEPYEELEVNCNNDCYNK